jgi:hypothetical protein
VLVDLCILDDENVVEGTYNERTNEILDAVSTEVEIWVRGGELCE